MKRNPVFWTPIVAIAATAGAGMVGFGVGTVARKRRVKEARDLLKLNPALLQSTLRDPTFKFPKISVKPKSLAKQLDENLRAFFVIAELLAQFDDNLYERALVPVYSSYSNTVLEHDPSRAWPWSNEPGNPPGFLTYGPAPWIVDFPPGEIAKLIWDKSPIEAVQRSQWLVSYALRYAQFVEEAIGRPIPTGDNDAGPSLGEMAEDYVQDMAVTYLAAAIPGGIVVLAIADQLGIGWPGSSQIRKEVSAGIDIPQFRKLASAAAEAVIQHAYANQPAVITATAVMG